MSNAQSQARQQAIDYMVRLLQMNPIQEGEEIVRARGKALGLKLNTESKTVAPAEEQKADRRKLLERLEAVRELFWTMPIEELNKRLRSLSGQGFQDVEAAIARLRVVASHRAQFPALAGKPGFDGEFFSKLKEVLVRSPRDTAVLREQVLSTFRNRARRKQGRRMLDLIKTEMPDIYELEADWFNTLYRQKVPLPVLRLASRSNNTGMATVGSRRGSNTYWWIIPLVIAAVRGLTALSDHSSSDTSSNRSYWPPKTQSAPPSYSTPSRVYNPPQSSANDGSSGIPNFDNPTWGPSSTPHPPARPVQPTSPWRVEPGGNTFPRPRTFEPNVPSNTPNGRFPR